MVSKKFLTQYDLALDYFMSHLKTEFNVVSVVLYGSMAKKTLHEGSDIDVLVVLEDVPTDWRVREKLLFSLVQDILFKYHINVSPVVCSKEMVRGAIKQGNPLFYGLLTGYSILYDTTSFFKKMITILSKEIVIERPVYIDEEKTWNLAEIV